MFIGGSGGSVLCDVGIGHEREIGPTRTPWKALASILERSTKDFNVMEKRLLNVKELSHYLAMPVPTIYTYVHTQRIPPVAVLRMGRALRFEKEQIDRWVTDQKISVSSDGPHP